jgi:phosphohistidine phosphatase
MTMELYFLRHGEAAQQGDWDGGDDERPLSREGTTRMKREAAAIGGMKLGIELIVTSPLVRARQTADIVARELHLRESLVIDDRLAPGFGRDAFAQVLKKYSSRKTLMLVGHEPDFSEVIAACIGGGRIECKKGGLARVDIDDPSSLHGVLVWLIPPRVLAP